MFIINKDQLDEIRVNAPENGHVDEATAGNAPEQAGMPPLAASDTDATQRLPVQRSRTPSQQRPRPAAPRPTSGAAAAQQRKKKKQKERLTIIILLSAAAVLLVGIIIAAVSIFSAPKDDGRILNNIYAAGVNIGGMSKEQAKAALHEATDHTYTKLDMSVTVLNTTVTLSPDKTGASLNVDGIVQAAYDRGRTGSRSEQQQARAQALVSAYHVPISPYLNLDTDYIRDQINKLGKKYSTTLSQSTYEITGDAPSMDVENKDTTVVYQTLHVHIGTAEYGLSATKLYEQIIDAYNSNIFQVTGECTVVAPDMLNCEEIYNLYCVAPQDAAYADPNSYEVIPEAYGYGFDLESFKLLVSGAEYGATLEVPLTFIAPNITAEELSGETFKDTLSSFRTKLSANADYNHNLTLVCNALNNLVIKPEETFSFNTAVGQPNDKDGYKAVMAYVGKEYKEVMGGGISQVASTLYYCALMADLEIVERVNHYYIPDYCDAGMDADISYGALDLRFTNTSGQPIRIQATVSADYIEIALIGTANAEYTVKIETEIVKTYEPTTLLLTLPADNASGYKSGDVLVAPITGYSISTYRCVYRIASGDTEEPVDPNTPVLRELLTQSHYEKRNQIVVEIEVPVVPEPSEPTAEVTEPSETTEPTESTTPSESQPTEPPAPSEPEST